MDGTTIRRSLARARVLARTMPLIGLVFLLTGCATVTATSTFRANGEATHSLVLVAPRDAVPKGEQLRFRNALDNAERNAVEDGLTVRRIDTDTQIGIHLSGSSKEPADTAAALNSLVNSLLGSPDSGPFAIFQGTYERTNPAVGGNEFDLRLTVQGEAMHDALELIMPTASLDRDPEKIVTISYTATMPGKIRSTNGEKLNDSTVKWTIPLYGDTTLTATSTVGKDTPWILVVLTIIAVAGIIALMTAAITRMLIGRRRAQRELAFQSAAYSPVDLRKGIAKAVRQAIDGTETLPQRKTPGRQEEQRGAHTEGN